MNRSSSKGDTGSASVDRREQLETILYAIPHGIDIVDEDCRILFMNRSLLDLFGDVVGKKCFEAYRDNGQQCENCPLRRPLVVGESKTVEVTGIGGGRIYSVTHTAITLPQSKDKAIVEVFMDVTEQKKLAKKEIALNEIRNKFIQVVSHQLRTPLSAVRWNLESLLESGGLREGQLELIRISRGAEIEVIRRLHDMLTALDIEEGRVTLNKELVSMDELIGSVMSEMSQAAARNGVVPTFRRPKAAMPDVKVDMSKIRDVFFQILKNACEYTAKGGKIDVRLLRKGRFLRVEVADTGIGIPATEQRHVFSMFFRASNAQRMVTDASGLGLYLAKNFIGYHGGDIGFSSREGEGSVFWFLLPLPKKP